MANLAEFVPNQPQTSASFDIFSRFFVWSEKRWAAGWDVLFWAIIAAIVLLTALDAPLLEPDESRYAEIPRLMLRRGDWITPKLQGKAYNDKPPLVYWLIAASYSFFGVSIQSARLVPAITGWMTILLVYIWGRHYLGKTAAGWCCLLLLSMLGFMALMRMLLLDGPFTFFLLAALLSGHHALKCRLHPGWALISAICCGLAVLAKGPVALVLITPCLFALRWLDKTTSRPPWTMLAGYVLVMLAIALPWYLTMMVTNESFGSEHFLRHHLRRFLDPAHHERPFWYYIPVIAAELLPWPILFIPLLRRWRSWTGNERFLMCFSTWCFLFFSISRAKLPTYLLPILPPLALLLGNQLVILLADLRKTQRLWRTLGWTLAGLLIALSFRNLILHLSIDHGTPHLDFWPLLAGTVLAITLTMKRNLVSKLLLPFLVPRRILPMAACLVMLWISHVVIPEFCSAASVVPDCLELVRHAEQEEIPFAAYRNSWDAVSFELGGDELDVFSSKEWSTFSAWLVSHPRSLIWMRDYEKRTESFLQMLPPNLEVEELRDLGKLQAFILRHKPKMISTLPPRR